MFGAFNIFYGGKLFRITIMLFGIVSAVASISFLLFFILEINDLSQTMIWLCLLSAASIGTIIGYFLTKIIRVGVFVIGCWTGVILAIVLDSMIFYRFHLTYFLYIMIVCFVAIFGWLAYKYYEYVLIFSSSTLGSYFFIRGLSLIIGGYPNETDVLEQVKHGVYVEIPWTFYLYLLFMLVLSVFGVVVQVKRFNNGKQNKAKAKKKGKRKLKIKKKSDVAPGENKEKTYVDMEEEVE